MHVNIHIRSKRPIHGSRMLGQHGLRCLIGREQVSIITRSQWARLPRMQHAGLAHFLVCSNHTVHTTDTDGHTNYAYILKFSNSCYRIVACWFHFEKLPVITKSFQKQAAQKSSPAAPCCTSPTRTCTCPQDSTQQTREMNTLHMHNRKYKPLLHYLNIHSETQLMISSQNQHMQFNWFLIWYLKM